MSDANIRITVDSSGAIKNVEALSGAIEDFDRRVQKADGTVREFEKGTSSFRRAVLGVQAILSGFGLSQLIKELVKVNTEFERVRYALLASSNSAAAAAADFSWVRAEAQKLGMPLSKVGIEYAKLASAAKDTALQGQPVRDIFSAVTKASMAMGLETAATQRIFMSLTQMLSKGRVQAEEARQQFGEHLPGGFKALAKAAGFDAVKGLGQFSQALTKGKVDAVDMLTNLPKVLDEMFGPTFEAALISSPQMAINQFKSMFDNLLYDIGQKGSFMKEFVGLLKDMNAELSSDTGRQQVEKLSNALGTMMAGVRAVSKILIDNLQSVAAAFAGLVTSSTILGLRGVVGWMGKLAGATSIVSALTNPWILLATAVGMAVSALIQFSDKMVTINGTTAKFTDWLKSGVEVLGQEVEKAGIYFLGWLESLPHIGGIVTKIVDDFKIFGDQLKKLSSDGLSMGDVISAFFSSFTNFIDPLIEKIKSLEPIFNVVKGAVLNTLSSMASTLVGAFNGIVKLAQDAASSLQGLFDKASSSGAFENLAKLATTGMSAVLNGILGTLNGVTVAVKLAVDLISLTFRAILPAVVPTFEEIIKIVSNLAAAIQKAFNFTVNKGPWDFIKGILGGIYDTITDIVSGALGIVSFAAQTIGSLINSVGAAIRGILNVVEAFAQASGQALTETAVKSTEAHVTASGKTKSVWIDAGDKIVGTILTVISALGLMIETVGAVIATIIDLGSRANSIFNGLAMGITGALFKDKDKTAAAADLLADAVSRPLENRFTQLLDDIKEFGGNVKSNFNVISEAVSVAQDTRSAFDKAKKDFANGFNAFNTDTLGAGARTAYNAGANTANSYTQGLIDTWSKSAGSKTQAAQIAQARLEEEQRRLAEQQAKAWEDQNNSIDRSARANPMTSHQTGHHKSPAERASEQIADLMAQKTTDTVLTAQIAANPRIDSKSVKAIEDAQAAIKKAGYDVTYGMAQNQGGLVKKLADTAFQASIARQQLELYRKAQETIAKNDQAVSSYKEQIDIARDLTKSGADYRAELAGQQALRQAGFEITYGEAQAYDNLGNAIHPVEKALADSAAAQERWNEAAKAADSVATALRGFKQTGNELAAFSDYTLEGTAGLERLKAEFEAQRTVMDKYGDDVFDSTRLLDENTKALYDQAKAFAAAGGSAESYASTVNDIMQTYDQLRDPIGAARRSIVDASMSKQQILDAGLNLAQQRYNSAMDPSALLSDPANINRNVEQATQAFTSAKQQYDQATAALAQTTQASLMYSSNSLSDAAKASFLEIGKDAADLGSQMRDIFTGAFDGMADALTTFVTTGKLSFADLARSVIADITRMIIKFMIFKAIETVFLFKDGGIMTSSGAANLATTAYATGGVANSPQLALFGEGSKPEAFVPLPDGRTIPVTLSGSALGAGSDVSGMSQAIAVGVSSGLTSAMSMSTSQRSSMLNSQATNGGSYGGGGALELHTHVHVEGNGKLSSGDQNADDKFISTLTKKMAAEMKAQVLDTVENEMRPGGRFNRMGSNKERF